MNNREGIRVLLETRHLRLIVAVSEEKSVTRAGGRLHLTQSALSHQLKDLEERLGTPLFHRVNKRMLLTPAGERVLLSARKVLGELRGAEEDVANLAAGDRGPLRISTECYTCYHWLPGVMKPFSRRFPQVGMTILLEATHHPIEALLEGKLDIAIVSDPARDKRLVYHPLFRDEVVVIMAPSHPLAARAFIAAKDFVDQTLFSYVPSTESTLHNRILLPAGVRAGRFSQVQLTEAMIEMVKAGLGISALARWAVSEPIKAGSLIARPLTRKGFHRQWYAAVLKTETTPSYLPEFISLLATRAFPAPTLGKVLPAA